MTQRKKQGNTEGNELQDEVLVFVACAAASKILEFVKALGPEKMWPAATPAKQAIFAGSISRNLMLCRSPSADAVLGCFIVMVGLFDGLVEGRFLPLDDKLREELLQGVNVAANYIGPLAESIDSSLKSEE